MKTALTKNVSIALLQVVWKDTVSIGCAQSACIPELGNNLWSCRFHPPGNYLGAFQANVFEKVNTTCPSSMPPSAPSAARCHCVVPMWTLL